MKKLSKLGLLIATMAIVLVSCKKPKDPEVKQGDRTAFLNKIKFNREAKTQIFEIDPSVPGGKTIKTQNGMELDFFPGTLKDQDGNIVTGIVEVKVLDVYSKSDLLLVNKPTMGIMPNGDRAMLVTAGSFLITASQNGEALELANPLMVKVPADNTGGADEEMTLWEDDIIDECDAIICENNAWEEVVDTLQGQGGVFIENINGTDFYTAFLSNFGWANLDRFYSFTGPKTTLLVDAPEGFDNTNCAIYISYDGEQNTLAACDTYNDATKLFSEHYGQIPVGKEIHVIGVSIIDNNYSYSIKAVTVADGETIVLDAFVSGTEADLVAAIDLLP